MKNLIINLIIFFFICCFTSVNAATYDELVSQSKPGAILIYADWIDDVQSTLLTFGNAQQQYGNKYGFAKVNICEKEAKSFNQRNYIYPNLPYIILIKERGRITRLITKDCMSDDSCLKEKLEFFAN